MHVAAVVLHYRNPDEVVATVRALDAQTRRPSRVFVVDNASGADVAAGLAAAFPEHAVIALPRNGGYAAGMNAGIRAALDAGADAVLLLTHETLLAPDALAAMAARLDAEPTTGAVGPLVGRLDDRAVVWSAGGAVERRTWTVRHVGALEPMSSRTGDPYAVDWLDGCALLLRAAALREAGPIDEAYFLYFEEVDYLFRLARLGWRVECVPAARAWQRPGSPDPALMQRNRLRFVRRAGGIRALSRALAADLRAIARTRDTARLHGVSMFLTGRRP